MIYYVFCSRKDEGAARPIPAQRSFEEGTSCFCDGFLENHRVAFFSR